MVSRKDLDLVFEPPFESILFYFKVVACLKVEPETLRDPKIA